VALGRADRILGCWGVTHVAESTTLCHYLNTFTKEGYQ
jgi:hypothetical protein